MANGIRTGDPRGFNKGRSSKFRVGRQTPEEGRSSYRPKRCGNNNKNEDNSLKTLNDNKHCKSPVGRGCILHRLYFCRGITPHQWVSRSMTQNNLMMRLLSRSFGECGVLLHCHYSQVHYNLKWPYLSVPSNKTVCIQINWC